MDNFRDDSDSSLYHDISYTDKQFSIPLMSKKQNTIEKYIGNYKLASNKLRNSSLHRRADSMLSSNGSRLVFGGKFTPDDRAISIDDANSYVRYSPLKHQTTEDRIQILQRVENQYSRLKNNFQKNKQPLVSKFSLPLRDHAHRPKLTEKKTKKFNLSSEELSREMKKQTIDETGRKMYMDLEMIKKGRTKLLRQIQNGKKSIQIDESEQFNQEEQKELLQKKIKQIQEKKKKMLQKKGLHWNVYYEMMALNNSEKEKVKNSRFVELYGGK